MTTLPITGQTDVGQRRTDNQDTFICSTIWSEASALLAAIDGVGGYAGGDRAAAIAKESIEQYMAKPNGDPLSMLREAVVFANDQINKQRQQDARLGQMCCVLTAAVADAGSGNLYFVHVGDTRLYRFRQGMLEKLTHDHSLVGVREDAGELTEAEAMQHPRRNEIMREVGSATHRVDDPDFLESGQTDFAPGDALLLCSDGLTDMITQAQMVAVLNQPLTLEQQAAELIRLANQAGGKDNITVVLAKNNGLATESPVVETIQTEPTLTQKLPPLPVSADRRQPVANPKPVKRSFAGLWLLVALGLVSGIVWLVWYQNQPSGYAHTEPDSLRVTRSQAPAVAAPIPVPSLLDSLVQTAHQHPDHRLTLPADTLRIDKPLLLTDSLQTVIGNDRITVIMPTDTTRAQVAMRVTHRGLVTIENILISGFRTGIETTSDTKLNLSKVYFRGVDLPISAAIRQDTFRRMVVGVSLQNQPVSPQPSRP